MGKFGWSLPPGVTHRMIEEQFGDEGPCQCCGHDVTDCICPECPVCHEQGNPKCYQSSTRFFGRGRRKPELLQPHLIYNREQQMGQARMRIAEYQEKIQDEQLFLAYMEEHPEEDPT